MVDQPTPIEIPIESLSSEALHEIVHSFIAREGTDYGEVEASVEQKVADLLRQLERGEIRLMFDPSSESVTFINSRGRSRPPGSPAQV